MMCESCNCFEYTTLTKQNIFFNYTGYELVLLLACLQTISGTIISIILLCHIGHSRFNFNLPVWHFLSILKYIYILVTN